MLAQYLGWTATVLFTACYIPQIYKTLNAQTVDGLSLTFLIIQLIANIIAFIYACMIGQTPLLVKYIAAILMLSAVIAAAQGVRHRL